MKSANDTSFSSGRPPRVPTSSRPPRSPYPSQTHLFRTSIYRRPRTKDPYIPPFRLQRQNSLASEPPNTSTEVGQKRAWTNMKKRINKIINIVNSDNVANCAKALFRLNLIRARGVFVKTLLRVQLASPDLSPVLACLIAVIGSRLPQVTELFVGRLIAQLKAAYANQDRVLCFATARFIAHLYNQHVVSDLLLFEFLTACICDPSDGSIEVAVTILRECTVLLSEESPVALDNIFRNLRKTLYDADISRRVQVMIERLIETRRKATTDVVLDPRLDLLHTEDIITHFMSLDTEVENDLEYECNNFHYDPHYDENEREYEAIKRDILGAEADFASPSEPAILEGLKTLDNGEIDGTSQSGPLSVPSLKNIDKLKDMTEGERVDFRHTVYLTISSGLSYEEWAHKLLKLMEKHSGMELLLCEMIVECCSHEKTYLRAFGLLGQRLCILNSCYISKFEELFAKHYGTIHRFDITRIRNMAGFYASLFASDSLPWTMFTVVRIVENETTSSSRIFLKVLFEEIAFTLGKTEMRKHFVTNCARGNLDGVLPNDNVDNAHFAIRFFQAIGLGYVTDELQSKLKSLPNAHKDDKDDSSSLSSSVSSSSSSSLSESSGLDVADEPGAPNDSASKRGQDESSLEPSYRPIKLRRRSKGVRNDEEGSFHGYFAESSKEFKEKKQKPRDDKTQADMHPDFTGAASNASPTRLNRARSDLKLIASRELSDKDSEADIDKERHRLRGRERLGKSRQEYRREKTRFDSIDSRERRSFSEVRNERGREDYRDGDYYRSSRTKELRRTNGHRRGSVGYCSDSISSDDDVRCRSQLNRRYDSYDERQLPNRSSKGRNKKSYNRQHHDYNPSSDSEESLSLRSKSDSPRDRRKIRSRSNCYRRSRSRSRSLSLSRSRSRSLSRSRLASVGSDSDHKEDGS